MRNKTITVSAPGKLMLFGEHAVIYGRPCIVTAVDQRINVRMEKIPDNLIIISAPEVGVQKYSLDLFDLGEIEYPKEVKFILKAVENFFIKHKVSSGLKITTHSDFSSLFGFGSSSAVTVCVLKALSEIFDIEVDNKPLFDIAYKTVLDVQGVGSGFDLAAAIWGGTLYFIAGGEKIIPIRIKSLPLIVGYTGIKADTATLVRQVAKLHEESENEVDKIFDSIGQIVEKAKTLLERADFEELGTLMNENQNLLTKLKVSGRELDGLITAANDSGAYGAKLSGAGGGDCMICLASKKVSGKVESSIIGSGGAIIRVKCNTEGVRIEK